MPITDQNNIQDILAPVSTVCQHRLFTPNSQDESFEVISDYVNPYILTPASRKIKLAICNHQVEVPVVLEGQFEWFSWFSSFLYPRIRAQL